MTQFRLQLHQGQTQHGLAGCRVDSARDQTPDDGSGVMSEITERDAVTVAGSIGSIMCILLVRILLKEYNLWRDRQARRADVMRVMAVYERLMTSIGETFNQWQNRYREAQDARLEQKKRAGDKEWYILRESDYHEDKRLAESRLGFQMAGKMFDRERMRIRRELKIDHYEHERIVLGEPRVYLYRTREWIKKRWKGLWKRPEAVISLHLHTED